MNHLPNWHLAHETRVLSKTSQSSETSLLRETTLMNNDDDRAVAASCVVFQQFLSVMESATRTRTKSGGINWRTRMLWEVAENENDRFLWFVHNMQFSLIEFFEFTNFCSFWTSLVSTFSSSYHKKWPYYWGVFHPSPRRSISSLFRVSPHRETHWISVHFILPLTPNST